MNLYIFIYILLNIFIFYLSRKKYGYIFNISFVVSVVWSICAAISIFNPLELRQPNNVVHYYSLLFLLAYNIPLLVSKIPAVDRGVLQCPIDDVRRVKRTILALEGIAILMLLPSIYSNIVAILSGNASELRAAFFETSKENYIVKMIMVTFPMAVLSSTMLVSVYLSFKLRNSFYIVNAIILTIIMTFISSGRSSLFSLLVIYFFLFVFYKGEIKRRISWKPIAVIVLMMAFVTLRFRDLSSGFLDGIILYFSGSFSFLDLIIDKPAQFGLDQLHYGYETFSIITEPVVYVLKYLGITEAKIPEYWLNINIEDFVDIGDAYPMLYNNNTTALYIFLLDFGPVGILIGGLLMGLLTVKTYKWYIKGNVLGSMLFLFTLAGLLRFPMSYQGFFGIGAFLQVFFLYFICRRIKNKNYQYDRTANNSYCPRL